MRDFRVLRLWSARACRLKVEGAGRPVPASVSAHRVRHYGQPTAPNEEGGWSTYVL